MKCISDSLDLPIVLLGHLQKAKKEFKNFKETQDSRYIYQNEIHKSCFQHDMIYGDFKNLPTIVCKTYLEFTTFHRKS